jgi:hypothetical protein
VWVDFGSPGRSANGKLTARDFVVFECSSAAARSLRRCDESASCDLTSVPEKTSALLSASA